MKIEIISAVALRSYIYEQMAIATGSEETNIVIRNKIVEDALNGFSSQKLRTKKLTLTFIGCIFNGPVSIQRIDYGRNVSINTQDCLFQKSVSIILTNHGSVSMKGTDVIGSKLNLWAQKINLESVHAEHCCIELTKKLHLSVGLFFVNTLRFSEMYSWDADRKTMAIRCHIDSLNLISKMLPDISIYEVFTDKHKHIQGVSIP